MSAEFRFCLLRGPVPGPGSTPCFGFACGDADHVCDVVAAEHHDAEWSPRIYPATIRTRGSYILDGIANIAGAMPLACPGLLQQFSAWPTSS